VFPAVARHAAPGSACARGRAVPRHRGGLAGGACPTVAVHSRDPQVVRSEPVTLLSVFLDVVAPVFAVAGLGFFLGPRLRLEARTLSRLAYHVLVPAFTFDVIGGSQVQLSRALRIAAFILATHVAFALLGWGTARLLRRSREVTAAYVMLAVFGNVGNFGLALLQFRLGPDALVPATIYFVVSLLISFVVSVGAAAWVRGGGVTAIWKVLGTPALLAAVLALIVSAAGVPLPLVATRTVELLGGAMIPIMLFVLGLQLAETRALRLSTDVLVVAGLRLVASPALAALLVVPFGIGGVDRATCILQAAMPAAVLVAVIANEHQVAPRFVIATVFFSTLLSLPVLTLLLALL
jgi:malate permease and related proteins